MNKIQLFLLLTCLLVSGPAPVSAIPFQAMPYGLTTDSIVPAPDSVKVAVREPGEGASRTAKTCALLAGGAALAFAMLPFPARTGLAVIFLFACLIGGFSGLASLALTKPKTKSRRRGGIAFLLIAAMFGIAVAIALKALDQG